MYINSRADSNRFFLFLAILLFAFIFQSSKVLDYTLWPKVAVLSVGFLGLLFYHFAFYRNALANQTTLSYLMLGLLIWTAISAAWSLSVPESIGEVVKLAVGCLFMFLINSEIKYNTETLLEFCKMVGLVLLISLLVGVADIVKISDLGADTMYSVTSICGHRNAFSSFIFLASIFNYILFFKVRGYWKALGVVNIILSLIFILLLQTRAVYLASFVAATCYALLYILISKKWKIAIIVSLLILLAVSLLLIFKNSSSLPLLYKANIFNYAQSASGIERLKVWEKTWSLFRESPIIGVGAGSWQFLFLKNGWGDLAYLNDSLTTFQRPHNDFLWVASELGIIGFVIWISIFATSVFIGVKKLFLINNLIERRILMFLISGVIGYLVISFFDFPKERIQHQLLIICMLCFLHAPLKDFKREDSRIPKFYMVLLILLAMGCVFISWQRVKAEYYMAKIYENRSQKRWSQVIKMTKKINATFYDTDPTSVPVSWYTGLAHFSMGEYALAKVELTNALSISPYNPHILNNYASASEMLGNHNEAKEFYEKALILLPSFDESRLNLAAIYFNENKIAEAKSLVLQAKPGARKMEYLNAIKQREKQ